MVLQSGRFEGCARDPPDVILLDESLGTVREHHVVPATGRDLIEPQRDRPAGHVSPMFGHVWGRSVIDLLT